MANLRAKDGIVCCERLRLLHTQRFRLHLLNFRTLQVWQNIGRSSLRRLSKHAEAAERLRRPGPEVQRVKISRVCPSRTRWDFNDAGWGKGIRCEGRQLDAEPGRCERLKRVTPKNRFCHFERQCGANPKEELLKVCKYRWENVRLCVYIEKWTKTSTRSTHKQLLMKHKQRSNKTACLQSRNQQIFGRMESRRFSVFTAKIHKSTPVLHFSAFSLFPPVFVTVTSSRWSRRTSWAQGPPLNRCPSTRNQVRSLSICFTLAATG